MRISALVVDNLRQRREVGAFTVIHFFCDFPSRQQHTTLRILQSLLRQAVEQGHVELIRQVKNACVDPSVLRNSEEIGRILAKACAIRKTYLILDAPDELNEPMDLLAFVDILVQNQCSCMVTSRDISNIRRCFKGAKQFEVKAHPQDLAAFVNWNLRQNGLLEENPGIVNLVDEVVEKSGQM